MARTDARPLAALAAVWLTTSGHTMSFREMNNAHGWITPAGYSLHTSYLFALVLTLPVAPLVARRLGSHLTAVVGLLMLMAGSFTNGFWHFSPWWVFVGGRLITGVGAALVIFAGPRLAGPGLARPSAWAGIILPAVGPPVVSAANWLYGTSTWAGGFLFEGLLATFGLGLVVSMDPPPEDDFPPDRPLTHLPAVVVATAGLWYALHWGQLGGWLAGRDVFLAVALAVGGAVAAFCIALPRLDGQEFAHALPRLLLVAYAGFAQYFNAADMGVYGGLLMNLDVFQRSWLIWSLSVGAAFALGFNELVLRGRVPRVTGAVIGLLVLAAGMSLAWHRTLGWPFWNLTNVADLNWFAAPQAWELAPARFLMGCGSALVLLAMMSPGPLAEREPVLRARLAEAQLFGGAVGVGVLATMLLTTHQSEYAYVADRGLIQAAEVEDRRAQLRAVLEASGSADAARQADVLTFRAVNYVADNLIFANIYGGFTTVSLALAAVVTAAGLSRAAVRLARRAGSAPSS